MKRGTILFLLAMPFLVAAGTHSNRSLPDSTTILTETDSISNPKPAPRSTYFAIGRGGSYGGLGIKVGKYHVQNEKLRATYIFRSIPTHF